MARRVFFSFHYREDIWRVSQIRNSGKIGGIETNRFLDAAEWESIRRKGESAVNSWIDRQLVGTGVTVVLIGTHTASRPYVRYEIEQSYRRGNGLVGIFIHRMKNQQKRTTRKGRNPLDDVVVEVPDDWFGWLGMKEKKRLSEIYRTYDWVLDDGRAHMPQWIEHAAKIAGR